MKTETETLCICGEARAGLVGQKDGVSVVACKECGTLRVPLLDLQDYAAMYQAGGYQTEHIATSVGLPNAHRRTHDHDIAILRLAQLSRFKTSGALLDLGCSNGAFVDAALFLGYDAWGVDLCDDAFEGSTAHEKGRLKVAELQDAGFQRRSLDVLTMNDVIEHLPDPRKTLRQACGLLKRDGLLVVDMPDFGAPLTLEGLAYRHVKPREHLWYPTPTRMARVLEECDFEILDIEKPVEGKVVFYARPNPHTVMDLQVYGPTGLGDIHWVILKLKALKDLESPCKLTLTIPGYGDPNLIFRCRDFFPLVPFIDEFRYANEDPVIVDEGAADPAVPTYRLIANGHIERGHRIETWYPHLATDFHYEIRLPGKAVEWAERIRSESGRKMVLFYPSSNEWNHSIANKEDWGPKDWTALTLALNDAGIHPILIGKQWDRNFADRLKSGTMIDLIGKTSTAQCIALFERADAVIGMCSGITIIAAHVGAPSIVFWPERGKGGQAMMKFHPDFQHDWVEPERLDAGTYVPLSIGAFSAETVQDKLKEWGVL